MATIRTRKTTRGTTYQAIVKIPRSGDRITKVFPKKTPAKDWSRKVEARIAELEAAKPLSDTSPLCVSDISPSHKPAPEPTHEGADNRTLGCFAEVDYPRWRRQYKKDRCKTRAAQVAWWVDKLGADTLIRDIRKGDIVRFLDEYADGEAMTGARRGQTRSRQSVDRMKAAISSLLSAAEEKDIIDVNVALSIKKRAKGQSMTIGKCLDRDERQRLLQAAREDSWDRMHLLVSMALITGGRRGEIMALRWSDIDFVNRKITFREETTKAGKERTVSIINELRDELLQFRQRSGLVFPSPKHPTKPFAFRNHWEATLTTADIQCRFHDLRHTAASILANDGDTSITDARDILGHSSVVITERYVHSDDGVQDRARDTMAAVFGVAR
jgi:integrase